MKSLKKNDIQIYDLPEKAQKFFDALLEKAFHETYEVTHRGLDLDIEKISFETLERLNWQSIMLTVSSSNFKIVVLLHFLPHNKLGEDYLALLQEHGESDNKYRDFISEAGNNLCGVACRALGSQNFSTGLSTPTLIENLHAPHNIRLIDIDYETHISGSRDDTHQLCASFYIFADNGFHVDGRMKSLNFEVIQNTGKLEFF